MFALLEHRTAQAAVHWDFLVEIPGQVLLATWRLAANPLVTSDPIAAERIGDHRRLYLDYEGDIGGGRGVVRRLDRGECLVQAISDNLLRVRLAGGTLRGIVQISAEQSGCVFRWMEL